MLSKIKFYTQVNLRVIPFIVFIIFIDAIQFSLKPSGFAVGDSLRYGVGTHRDWKYLSFFGNSVRNWPIVLVNLVLDNSILQTAAQFLLSIGVWTYLLINIRRLFPIKLFFLPASIICIFLATTELVSWNSTLLAESYGISTLVLTFSFFLRQLVEPTMKNQYLLALTFYLWISLQSRNFISGLVLVILLFIVYKFFSISPVFKISKFFLLFFSLLLVHSSIVNINQTNQFFDTNISYKTLSTFYTFTGQPEAPSVRSELFKVKEFGCMKNANFGDIFSVIKFSQDDCPDTLKWLNNHYQNWYFRYLIQHPQSGIRLAGFGLIAGNKPNVLYAGTVSVIPISLESLFFGDRNISVGSLANGGEVLNPSDIKSNSPIFIWIFIFLCFTFYLIKCRRSNLNKAHFTLETYLVIFGFWALFNIIFYSIINPAEFFKTSVQSFTLFVVINSLLLTRFIESNNKGR